MADFEEEIEEISNEEKQKIAQHYLLSSPPGQFIEVLSDVRKIVTADVLPDSFAAGVARVANIKNCVVVSSPQGNKVALHAAGEVDATHYVNPLDNSVFSVNHLNLSTQEDASVESNQDVNILSTQSALQSALRAFCKASYISETSAGSVYAKDGALTVVISGEKANLRNFWSGKWTSVWTVQLEDASALVSGDIQIHIHYFEDGNLQMQNHKVVAPTRLSFDSDADLSSKVVALIQDQESTLQRGLEDMYSSMNSETFKSMRRVMPITRTKMDWNVNAVRMVRQVRK